MAGTIATLLVRIAANTVEFEKNIGRLERNFQRTGRNLESIGERLSKGITLPIAAIAGVATKAAIEFESSFAGIRKTVKASEEQFKNLAQGMRNLAKEIPVNVNELNRIGEAAGQLGIKTENIESFTRVIAQLGTATNLSTDEAATALARLANITGLPQEKFSNLGSTIVALGNNFATTERDIVQFGLRIAGAGKTVGLSEAEILGFGAALSSVGVEAEAGGTAISKVFIEIAAATQKGGEDLARFAQVAGTSVAAFKQQFQTDAAGATIAFIEGLGKIQRAGGDVFGTIEALGLQETRLRNALLLSASAGDLLSRSVRSASSAFQENTALQREAEERYKTTASQLTLLRNRLIDVAITLGGPLVTALNEFLISARPLIGTLERLVIAFVNLPDPIRNATIGILAFAASVGPLIFVAGKVVQAFAAIASAGRLLVGFTGAAEIAKVGTAAVTGSAQLGLFSRALTAVNVPAALIAGAVLALVGTIAAFNRSWEEGALSLLRSVPGFRLVESAITSLSQRFPLLGQIFQDLASIVRSSIIIAFDRLQRAAQTVADIVRNTLVAALEALAPVAARVGAVIQNIVIPVLQGMAVQIAFAIGPLRDLLVTYQLLRDNLPGFADRLHKTAQALDQLASSGKPAAAVASEIKGNWQDVPKLFTGWVDDATKKFQQFGPAVSGALDSANKEVDRFKDRVKDLANEISGRNLVQEARAWATALTSIGGASKVADSSLSDFMGVIDQIITRFGSLERAGVGALRNLANAARTQLRRFTTFLPLSEGPRQGGFQGFFNVPTRSQQLPAGALLNGGLGIVPGLTDPGGLFDGVRLGQGAHELFRDFQQELADNALASRILLGDAFNGFFSDTFSPVRADQLVHPFRDAFISFGRELPNLIFGTLQSGGNVLGAVASGFAATLTGFVQAALDALPKGAALSGKSAGAAIAAQGIATFVSGFSIGQSVGSKGKGALAGAATGAAIGANPALAGATLGISIAVGAGIGALAGFFGGRSAEKKAKEQLEQNKIALIEQFGGMEKLRALADKLGVNITAAFDAKKPQQFQQAVDQLNAAIDRQNKKLEGLQKALEGVNAKAVLFASPFQKILDAQTDLLGGRKPEDLSGSDADQFKTLQNKLQATAQAGQAEFERLGVFVGATFAGIVADSGDAIGAIQQLGGAFGILKQGVEDFGLTASPLIQRLVDISSAVSNPETGPLFASLQATGQIFAGLQQAGLLTGDLFQVVGADIGQIFRDLEAKGVDMSIALALSQPVLQRLFEAQERFGLVTDDTTQKMLDQAKEQGLVGNHMRDVNQKILDVLIAIADVFGAKLPEGLRNAADAAGRAADDIENALAGIHVPPIKIPLEFDRPGPEGPEFLPLASGGIVRRPTFALIGEAGPEAVVPLARLERSGGGGGGHTFHRGAFEGMFEGAVIDSDARAEQVADMVLRVIEGGGKRKTRARRALVDG